jgi:dephospho-CoA kinase
VILKVGLTGGIASGKSTIARLFAERGCHTVDADRLVAELYRPGRAGFAAIVREYGTGVLDSSGEIDRAQLSAIAFQDEASIARLNALIHPIVLAEEARIAGEVAAAHTDSDAIYVVEATLLIEAGGRERYDRIVVVDVTPDAQLRRGVGRGMEEGEVRRRMEHQMDREERLRHADYVIDNSGDLEQANQEVDRVFTALMRDLQALRNDH